MQNDKNKNAKGLKDSLIWIGAIVIAAIVIVSRLGGAIRNFDIEERLLAFDLNDHILTIAQVYEDGGLEYEKPETIFGLWRIVEKSNSNEGGELLSLHLQLSQNGTGFYAETLKTAEGVESFTDFAMTWHKAGAETVGTLFITSSERFTGGVQTWGSPFRISNSRLYIENIRFYNLYGIEFAVFEQGV